MIDSQSINKRFLEAINHLTSDRTHGKITKTMIGERIGIKPISNLSRLANQKPGEQRSVTVEQCAKLCSEFFISPEWLLLGIGDMKIIEPVNVLKQDQYAELQELIRKLTKRVQSLEKARSHR